jgi:hypothetical protein
MKPVFVELTMLEPISNPVLTGYVPLCAALHWIMTSGGTRRVAMDDETAWTSSVDKLFPLICAGEIELIGLPSGRHLTERIPGHTLALVRLLPPLRDRSVGVDSPSHIACSPFMDEEHWRRGFNDQLYQSGHVGATWTHLQTRKADVLSRWPRPEPKAKSEQGCYRWLLEQMQRSPSIKSRSKEAIWTEAKQKFRPLAQRQFNRAWDKAIAESGAHPWAKAGRPSGKLNHRTD